MFKYNCQSCGLKLGDGLPPIEALDFTQRAAIGETDGTGLRMDGRSGYQYCEFCLLFEEFFGHMDRIEIPEDKRFQDYGCVLMSENTLAVSDLPLGNWTLMAMEVGGAQNLPTYLYDMWYDRRTMVMEHEIEIMERLKKEEEEKKTLRYKVRRVYWRLREKLSLPYHLKEGLKLLWWTITMTESMSEEEQEDNFDYLAYQAQAWHYENNRNAPFAKFELWALEKLHNRFFNMNFDNEEENR